MSEHRKRPTGTQNPSASSLRRWDNEGGAPAGGRTKRRLDTNQAGKSIEDVVTAAADGRPPKRKSQSRQGL